MVVENTADEFENGHSSCTLRIWRTAWIYGRRLRRRLIARGVSELLGMREVCVEHRGYDDERCLKIDVVWMRFFI